MKPHSVRVLHQLDADLSTIIDRYPEAVRRLAVDVTPGFASKTHGNGDPPGGSGGHGTSITERLAERHLPEVEDLAALREAPAVLLRRVHLLLVELGHVGAMLPPLNLDELPVGRRLRWCRWAVRQVIAGRDAIDDLPAGVLNPLSAAARASAMICAKWGYTPMKQKLAPLAPDELAHDPTDRWCRSCLRVGSRWPRYRGDLCQWCYRFEREERMLPPVPILEVRVSGKMVTEAMVARHRPKSKRKRKGKR